MEKFSAWPNLKFQKITNAFYRNIPKFSIIKSPRNYLIIEKSERRKNHRIYRFKKFYNSWSNRRMEIRSSLKLDERFDSRRFDFHDPEESFLQDHRTVRIRSIGRAYLNDKQFSRPRSMRCASHSFREWEFLFSRACVCVSVRVFSSNSSTRAVRNTFDKRRRRGKERKQIN